MLFGELPGPIFAETHQDFLFLSDEVSEAQVIEAPHLD